MPNSFTPPKAVQQAAKRGLELRKKHGRGGLTPQEAGKQGIGSGIARAVTLTKGKPVPLKTIKRMRSYFARHEVDKKGKNWGDPNNPSNGYIAWLLWGGDPGEKWANEIVNKAKQQESLDEATKKEKPAHIKKKLAKKGLSKLSRECSLEAFKHNLRREYHAGQTAQGTQHVAIALSVLKRSCGVDSKDRMTPKEIVAAGERKRTMNVETINALLVKAIGQIQESEIRALQEATPRFSPNEHDEPTKKELEQKIVSMMYQETKRGYPELTFTDIHMPMRPLFGEIFVRRYKGIVTQAINRLRRRGIVKRSEGHGPIQYILTPGGIQAAKTGNLKKVKPEPNKQEGINKAIIQKFILELLFDNKDEQDMTEFVLMHEIREKFRGEELADMLSVFQPALLELLKKKYVEYGPKSGWRALVITPAGSRARITIKIPEF